MAQAKKQLESQLDEQRRDFESRRAEFETAQVRAWHATTLCACLPRSVREAACFVAEVVGFGCCSRAHWVHACSWAAQREWEQQRDALQKDFESKLAVVAASGSRSGSGSSSHRGSDAGGKGGLVRWHGAC